MRAPDAILADLLALPAEGWALPREAGSRWGRTLAPLAEELAGLEARGEAMLAETDPRAAVALLPDFERVVGEDPCLGPAAALPLGLRQSLAWQRWTGRGGATPAFFVALAAALGVAITVEDYWRSEAADEAGTELLADGAQFEWLVRLPPTQLIDPACGAAECGDLLGDFVASIAACPIERAAPAHTTVVFSYAEAG